jgi:hypothetical protein
MSEIIVGSKTLPDVVRYKIDNHETDLAVSRQLHFKYKSGSEEWVQEGVSRNIGTLINPSDTTSVALAIDAAGEGKIKELIEAAKEVFNDNTLSLSSATYVRLKQALAKIGEA